VTSDLLFRPPLLLGGLTGDAAKAFPIRLRLFSARSDKREIYRLRYRAFVAAGWIEGGAKGLFADRYDELPTSFSIAAFNDGNCVGALRFAFGGRGSPSGSMPCEEEFPDLVQALTALDNKRLVEFGRMAIEPTLTNNSFRATLFGSLARSACIVATAAEADVALIAVHARLSRFYQSMCGFEVLGTSNAYAEIREPTHFLGREFRALDDRRRERNTFFDVTGEEVESMRAGLAAERGAAA